MMSWLIGLFRPKEPIIPEPCICEICYELEAKKRVCCNGSFCDHCYTKYKACPRCKNATRIEKMTGATYVLPMFNENEECRICLDAGVKRRCCGQYYCDDCYFRLAKCRSCDQLVDKNAFGVKSWGRAYIVTILLGWALTLLVGLILFTIIGIITLNAIQTPVGIQGFVCAGFFRTCDIAACIEVSHNVSLGTSALDSSFLWRECDLRSAYKLRAPACIFDSALYSSTNQILGYDVCKSSFHNDIIVFEDTFEDWANGTLASNTMVSGRWAEVYNGETGSYCGHGTEGGADALVFFGEVSRYAETLDVDLTLGGSIEADLFLAPLYFEQSHPQCRTAFTGVVSLQSSIDEGATWTTLKEFDPVKYRQKNFFRISADIPASSTVVLMRFRFIQLHFDSGGDNWALDNVRVLRHLPSTWLTNAAAQESRATSQREIQFASCCFDTDNCANRLTASEAVGCSTVPGFTTQRVHIREAEVWILLALALSVIKFIYVSIQDFLIQGKLPFQDEVEEILLLNFIREKIPARYRLKKESNDFVSDVHRAARLNAAHRHRLRDEDGKGTVMVKTKEEQEKINAERLAIKVKALQKKIRKMKKRGVIVHEEAMMEELLLEDARCGNEEESLSITGGNQQENLSGEAPTTLNTEMDDLKRSNLTLLRIAIETKTNPNFIYTFAFTTLSVFVALLLYQASVNKTFILFVMLNPFGRYQTQFEVTTSAISLFAVFCDFKEIYHILRHNIPLRSHWRPLVTVDKSDEVQALFIGPHTVKLNDIFDSHFFSEKFIKAVAAGYLLAAMPLALILLIMQEGKRDIEAMMYATPAIGALVVARVILGPSFLIKTAFCMGYLFDPHFNTREKMGSALKTSKTKFSALVAAGGISFLGLWVCLVVAYDWAGIVFGGLILVGLIYGCFAGCIHSLPIRPWFVLTTLEPGVWLHVKKKQSCPCVYWWSFCSDVHVNEEMLVTFPTDNIHFLQVLRGGR